MRSMLPLPDLPRMRTDPALSLGAESKRPGKSPVALASPDYLVCLSSPIPAESWVSGGPVRAPRRPARLRACALRRLRLSRSAAAPARLLLRLVIIGHFARFGSSAMAKRLRHFRPCGKDRAIRGPSDRSANRATLP